MSDVIICRCEEVTEDELRAAIQEGACTITGVKRRTGAGMGLCQGRTCRRLIASMIAEQQGISAAQVMSDTIRPPVRPVRVEDLLCEYTREEAETGRD